MSTHPQDYLETQRLVEEYTRRGDELKRILKEGRIYELAASGERLLVRPVMMEQPRTGHRDPWFGLSYHDWVKFRREGFDGWMETTEGSSTPKVMIMVEKAERWLEARCQRQAQERESGKPKRRRPSRGRQPQLASA